MGAVECAMCTDQSGVEEETYTVVAIDCDPEEVSGETQFRQRHLHGKTWQELISLIEQKELDSVRNHVESVPHKHRQELLQMMCPRHGHSVLHVAARTGHVEMLSLLADLAPDESALLHRKDISLELPFYVKDAIGQTPLHVAASCGHAHAVTDLIESAPHPGDLMLQKDNDGRHAMVTAVREGHVDVLRTLIRLATEHHSLRALLDHADGSGTTPLHEATHYGALDRCSDQDVDMVAILLKAKANTDLAYAAGGATPLTAAADKGHEKIFSQLLSARACIEATNREGQTALIRTCRSRDGKTSIAKLLLEARAGVQPSDKKGWDALMHASAAGRVDMVETLILAQANVNEPGDKGNTALMCAAKEGHHDVVQRLLGACAWLERKNSNGNTAFILACTAGSKEAVNTLLAAKADARHADRHGITAMEAASYKGHAEIVELLSHTHMGRVAKLSGKKASKKAPVARGA